MSRGIGRYALQLGGWKFEGAMPDEPKFVIIVAPHTSNWDFVLGVAALFSLGLKITFLGKHTLFKGPLRPLMHWLGGVPVDRSVSRDRVGEAVAAFKRADRMIMAVAPEGTRKPVKEWKTGFYHIALGAGVQIVPVAFDYGRKTVRIHAPFRPTGNRDRDMGELRKLFRNVTPKRAENFIS